jgi:hypothetical protein
MLSRACLLALTASVLSGAGGFAAARGSANDVVMVRAEVRPSAVLKFEVQSPELKISDADIEIGFIDIAAGTLFRMSAGRLKPVITVEFPGDGDERSVELRPEAGSYRLKLADILSAPAGSGGTQARSGRHNGPLLLTVNF